VFSTSGDSYYEDFLHVEEETTLKPNAPLDVNSVRPLVAKLRAILFEKPFVLETLHLPGVNLKIGVERHPSV
jgi:hypothetical protein